MSDDRRNKFRRISTATTTVVKSAPGTLFRVVVNKPVSGSTITVYDNTAGSGTVLALITNSTVVTPYFLDYFSRCETGITVVTNNTDDITVVYA